MVTSNAFHFGELVIEKLNSGFVVRGPEAPGDPATLGCDPVAISNHIRIDDCGRYRPLSGARTMPSGWISTCAGRGALEAALDVIYPLARTHQTQWQTGSLRVVPLDDVLTRQSGRYASVGELSGTGRKLATRALCGDCVRTPIWIEVALAKDGIPCPEACSLLVERCREAAMLEHDRPGVSST